MFLSSKNVNDYLNYKESVFKKLITTKFDFKLIHSQADLKIEQSYKIDKVFKLENVIDLPVKKIKEEFLSAFMKRNKYLVHSQILEDFSKKYRAVYEKYMIKGKIHELISIKEENLTEH